MMFGRVTWSPRDSRESSTQCAMVMVIRSIARAWVRSEMYSSAIYCLSFKDQRRSDMHNAGSAYVEASEWYDSAARPCMKTAGHIAVHACLCVDYRIAFCSVLARNRLA